MQDTWLEIDRDANQREPRGARVVIKKPKQARMQTTRSHKGPRRSCLIRQAYGHIGALSGKEAGRKGAKAGKDIGHTALVCSPRDHKAKERRGVQCQLPKTKAELVQNVRAPKLRHFEHAALHKALCLIISGA